MIFKDCAILWRLLFNPTQRMLFGSSKKGVREFAFSVFRELEGSYCSSRCFGKHDSSNKQSFKRRSSSSSFYDSIKEGDNSKYGYYCYSAVSYGVIGVLSFKVSHGIL